MQLQPAEALCLPLQIGRIDLVSMPSDYLPRRIDWGKWLDCVNMGAMVMGERLGASPRISVSPDHQDAKDNLALTYFQGQGTLEQIDPVTIFSDVTDGARFIFVGSWSTAVPTWFTSAQSIFAAQYASLIPDFIARQFLLWGRTAERLEKEGSFLVTDDLGRLSGLSSIGRSWRNRAMRSSVMGEPRSASWLAAIVDVPMARSASAVDMRLHRLNVIEPEVWCGSPKLDVEIMSAMRAGEDCPEIWISAPSVGVALWIAEQQYPLNTLLSKLHVPGATLGWHPVRDLLAFLSRAKDGSMFYMVDRQCRLQVLKKDGGVL
jgi:hypothetical protein